MRSRATAFFLNFLERFFGGNCGKCGKTGLFWWDSSRKLVDKCSCLPVVSGFLLVELEEDSEQGRDFSEWFAGEKGKDMPLHKALGFARIGTTSS
jgi:hypothetical protein